MTDLVSRTFQPSFSAFDDLRKEIHQKLLFIFILFIIQKSFLLQFTCLNNWWLLQKTASVIKPGGRDWLCEFSIFNFLLPISFPHSFHFLFNLQILFTWTDDGDAVRLCRLSVDANVLNDRTSLQDRLHLAQADVLAELKLNLMINTT